MRTRQSFGLFLFVAPLLVMAFAIINSIGWQGAAIVAGALAMTFSVVIGLLMMGAE